MNAPASATCAAHPDAPASWICRRCGTFMCTACERRVRPEAVPMCPGCWALRERAVAGFTEQPRATLQNVGLALGVVSLLPGLFLVQVPSLIVCVLGLVRAKNDVARRARWRAAVGLGLTLVGGVLSMALFHGV
jgi:B-box zinc finger